MDLVKNQKLRYQIQKDSNGDQITYGYEGAPKHLSSMPSVDRKRAKKSRNLCPRVLHAVSCAEQDCNDRLNDKPQTARA
jgi:hypothetical protein